MNITRENLPDIIAALTEAINAYQRNPHIEAARAQMSSWTFEEAVESARKHAITRLADALGLEEEKE